VFRPKNNYPISQNRQIGDLRCWASTIVVKQGSSIIYWVY